MTRVATKADLDEYRGKSGPPLLCGVCFRPLRAGSLLDSAYPWHAEMSHHVKCQMDGIPDDREYARRETEWWLERASKRTRRTWELLEKAFGASNGND